MELQTKKQIDDLIEYTKAIKEMYSRIAVWDIIPEELSKEEQTEIDNILIIINKALEIEAKKVSAIDVNYENIDAISDYLIRFYDNKDADDFLYKENHIERTRVLNRLRRKLTLEALRKNIPIENKNIDYAILLAIENNFVYAIDYEMQKSNEVGFSYLKQGRIFISSFYDKGYFPERRVRPIVHYSHFSWLMQHPTKGEINKTALELITEEYIEIIKTLYDGFTNIAMRDPSTFWRAMNNLMIMNTYLISTLDTNYIDSSFLKFQEMKNQEKQYSQVNDLIQGILVRSKKQVLDYYAKKDDK